MYAKINTVWLILIGVLFLIAGHIMIAIICIGKRRKSKRVVGEMKYKAELFKQMLQ